jgi:xylan 1,4-beta-xylosidase
MRLATFRFSRFGLSVVLLLGLGCAPGALLRAQSGAAPQTLAEAIEIDANAASHPFPHFWERMFGSGRAILALRDDYRNDLRETKRITDLEYVRFHAIFHDEVGLYDEDQQGKLVYNYSYVDQIYDGLLANHVRPFVELSFMPKKMTSDPSALHPFWYKQNVAPPKDWNLW